MRRIRPALSIAQKKQVLHQANEKIVSVEKKLTEDYRKELEEKIKLKKEDLVR